MTLERHPTIEPVPYIDGVNRVMTRTDQVCAALALPITIAAGVAVLALGAGALWLVAWAVDVMTEVSR